MTVAGVSYYILAALAVLSFASNRGGLRWWRVLALGALLLLSAYQLVSIGVRRGGASPGGWHAQHRQVLAEVELNSTGVAADRAGADPDDLARGAQLVHPRR